MATLMKDCGGEYKKAINPEALEEEFIGLIQPEIQNFWWILNIYGHINIWICMFE